MGLGNVTDVKMSGDTLNLTVESDQLLVQVCKPAILKVDYRPNGMASPSTPIIDPDKIWNTGNILSVNTVDDPMVIETSKMIINIYKRPCRLFIYNENKQLLSQSADSIYRGGLRFAHNATHNFYGIGEDGDILKNNGGTVYAGSQGHSGGPFVWCNEGYGLLVDSDGGNFSINSSTLEFKNGSKINTEFYIIVGSPADIMAGLMEISGKPPMFPKWAMGFTNTEWGIDENELKNIVNTYRAKQIPIDNYCLDFDWKTWGEDNFGEFRWNTNKFPNGPSGVLKSQMAEKGIKLTGILKPRIHLNTVQAQEVTNGGWWLPGSQPFTDYCSKKLVNNLDCSNPGLRDWYFKHHLPPFDTGIIGWWNDEADEAYNNWGHLNMEKGMYEGQRAYINQRVWSINRNFYLGAQRYAFGLWSGDIGTGFETMADQRRRMLGSIHVGAAKWGMDTGGFHGNPTSENYARWMQFSAFTPIFRVHGQQNMQRQPWVFGEKAEAAAKKVMQLRYRLIPYIYAYERRAYESGVGLVNSLAFYHPHDSKVDRYQDAWMFGEYLLAAPVVEEGQTVKPIYLPDGVWIDYFKGTSYIGGKTINYKINSGAWDDVPLFIKRGAIIPSQDFVNYVGEKPITTVYIDVFPDYKQTSFQYYDDDGITYNYEKGEYFKQTMTTQGHSDYISFTTGDKVGTFTPDLKYYIVKMHCKATGTVTVDGKPVMWHADYNTLQQAEEESWTTGSDDYGDVTYVKLRAGAAKNIIIPGTIPTPVPIPVIPVTFTINKAYTYWGQNVYITGNITEIGKWSPENAAGPAGCPNYPTWTMTIDLPPGEVIEFKAIKKDGNGNVVWQGGSNHTYTIPAKGSGNVVFDWQD